MIGLTVEATSAATDVNDAEYAAAFDLVTVCSSKTLAAPIGSCLVGSRDFINRTRRFNQQTGSGFLQAGIIAGRRALRPPAPRDPC
jgi:threonine aldolase